MRFEESITDYQSTFDKKGTARIKFVARTKEDTFRFDMQVFSNGSTIISVTPTNRQNITYQGELAPKKEDCVGGGRFEPKTLTTRAQLVQILYRLAGAPEVSGETPFTDLTADWYKTAVLWAYQTGVTSGVSETTFAPDTPVTREQVAVFLARFADRVLDRYTPYMWDALFPFQDREQISYYARTAMNWACDLGLIKGIPGPGGLRLEPQSSATREQMAVMIARFCRRLNVWNEPMPEL